MNKIVILDTQTMRVVGTYLVRKHADKIATRFGPEARVFEFDQHTHPLEMAKQLGLTEPYEMAQIAHFESHTGLTAWGAERNGNTEYRATYNAEGAFAPLSEEGAKCQHNAMKERPDDPMYAWECTDCGYVYEQRSNHE